VAANANSHQDFLLVIAAKNARQDSLGQGDLQHRGARQEVLREDECCTHCARRALTFAEQLVAHDARMQS
jgi:hypothetical protein